jgi:hypothetical protein
MNSSTTRVDMQGSTEADEQAPVIEHTRTAGVGTQNSTSPSEGWVTRVDMHCHST